MSGVNSIHETCACGSEFRWTGYSAALASTVVDKWRKNHKHSESVGICGDRPEVIGPPGHLMVIPHCVLKAGHAGMHGDGEGAHWTRRPTTARPADDAREDEA